MAVRTSSFYPQTILTNNYSFNNTDYNLIDVNLNVDPFLTADFSNLLLTSTDTVDRIAQLYLVDGNTDTTYLLATVNVPANSGNSTSLPPINILNEAQVPGVCKDSDGNPFIRKSGLEAFPSIALWYLGVLITTAPTAGKFITWSVTIKQFT